MTWEGPSTGLPSAILTAHAFATSITAGDHGIRIRIDGRVDLGDRGRFGLNTRSRNSEVNDTDYEIVRPNSFLDTPSASNDFNSKSIDTVGSPASIFATLDWLDAIAFASCA